MKSPHSANMSSFPGDKLTLDDIKALEQLESADSLGLDDLSFGLLPSSDLDNPKVCDPAYNPVAGPVISSKAVELAGAPVHNAPGNKSHSGAQLPTQVYSAGAELHCLPQETLTPEEISLWDLGQVQKEATLKLEEDPVLKLFSTKDNLGTPITCQISNSNPQTSEFIPCDPISKASLLQGPVLEGVLETAAPQPEVSKRQHSAKKVSTGSGLDPKKEAQRRYRARSRQKAQEARAQLELNFKQAKDEIEALKLEQETLKSRHSVLQGMIDYKDSLIASVRTTLENFTTASSTIYSFAGELQNVIWNRVINASDEQIIAISKCDATIRSINRVFFNMLTKAMIEWGQASSPANRACSERKLGFILGVRLRGTNFMWDKNPLRVSRVMHAPPVDPDCLAKFAQAKASCLANEDLMAAAALTEEQKVALTRYWNEYLDKYNDSRGVWEKSAEKLDKSIVTTQNGGCNGEVVGNLTQSANGYLSAAEIVAELDGFTSGELLARAGLILGAWNVLRPLQQAILMFDITPKIDIVAIYKTLLRLDTGNGGGGDHSLEQCKQTAPSTLCQC
ncbi:hypothetical protein Ndes2526B_g01561 [Nannochloris sp. 'desiccata']